MKVWQVVIVDRIALETTMVVETTNYAFANRLYQETRQANPGADVVLR